MRTIFATILFSLFLVSTVFAAPFLVCNPYPTTVSQPDSFVISLDGGTTKITVPAYKNADNSVMVHYDMAGLTQKVYQVTGSACTGILCSAYSTVTTISYITPTTPGGFSLSAN